MGPRRINSEDRQTPLRTELGETPPMPRPVQKTRIPSSLLAFSVFFIATLSTLPNAVAAGDLFFLQSKCQAGGVYSVVEKIQVTGTVDPSTDAKTRPLPLTVDGQFAYEEMRFDDGRSADRRSVRCYREAAASIQVGKHRDSPKLRDEMRVVSVRAGKSGLAIASPNGPMTREELDLIDIPGNTLILDQLLPEDGVKTGGSWKIPDAALAQLVCADVVSRNEVQCELADADDAHANIRVAGHLNAATNGVATEMDLDGTASFDLSKKCLTSIQMSIKERRSVGYIGPAMDVTARLEIQISPEVSSELLTPAIVKSASEDDPSTHPLALRSELGGYHLVYDRRWHVTRNETQLVVLRLIDRGELVAQCNISPLPRLDQGKTVTIEQFQTEVRQSLAKRFDHFETVAEGKGAGGMRVLKVIASGFVSELPIQWRYYLAIAPDGRRLALSYTMENDLVQRFADSDTAMTESIEFDKVAPAPTPADDSGSHPSEKSPGSGDSPRAAQKGERLLGRDGHSMQKPSA